MAAPTRHRLLTPPPVGCGAAIAVIQLEADAPSDLDDLLTRARWSVRPGGLRVRSLLAVDTGLVLRDSPHTAQIMPHGGAAVLAALSAALTSAGCPPAPAPADPRRTYPEAHDQIEACALDAIARAPSPLAVDAILRQRDVWRAPGAARLARAAAGRTRPLHRLLNPPTILLLGRPNIGKSALTNAIARRAVSVVADEPGTTRDHVGVMIDLAGLVVRWIDAPGITDRPVSDLDRAGIELTTRLIPSADLLLHCVDGADPAPAPSAFQAASPALTVGLRSDLAPSAVPGATLLTSARTGRGLSDLAQAARSALLPEVLILTREPWRFHPRLPA